MVTIVKVCTLDRKTHQILILYIIAEQKHHDITEILLKMALNTIKQPVKK